MIESDSLLKSTLGNVKVNIIDDISLYKIYIKTTLG